MILSTLLSYVGQQIVLVNGSTFQGELNHHDGTDFSVDSIKFRTNKVSSMVVHKNMLHIILLPY